MRRVFLAAVLFAAACGGSDGGGNSGPTGPTPNPDPDPDPTLQSVTCSLQSISDQAYDDQKPSVSSSWSGRGDLSDGSQVSLDSAVVSFGGSTVEKATNASSGNYSIAGDQLSDGSNTVSLSCYRDALSGSDSESFTVTQNPQLPVLSPSQTALNTQEGVEVGTSLAGIVQDGTLDGVTLLSGDVELRTPNDSLYANPIGDFNGTFEVEYSASNADGTVTETVTYEVEPIADLLAGSLQNSETDTGESGQLELLVDGVPLTTINADGSGAWSKTDLIGGSTLSIRASLSSGSYIRTVRRDISSGADVDIPMVRAVPFTGLSSNAISPSEFRQLMCELRGGGGCVIEKFDFDGFQGVFIEPESVEGKGTLTASEVDAIIAAFTDADDIPALIEGQTPPQIVIGESGSSRPYQVANGNIIPDEGWLIVHHDDSIEAAGFNNRFDFDSDGLIDSGRIQLKVRVTDGLSLFTRVVTHEAGHIWFAYSHPSSFGSDRTIMAVPVERERPSFEDGKAGSVMNEETFADAEELDDVFGLPNP